jgi:acyl-CoA synthetase (AMP-forming)/AMP-acid ligase II
VDAISATPTFLDLLLQNEPAGGESWTPRQITLGGEPLRAALGGRLVARWPATRFVTIYASAEFGVLLKTRRLDGWYELASLEARWPDWRVTGGVLELGDDGRWLATGDRVEVNGDLMRVLGRADHVANVAGTKVNLPEIGMMAEEVPGVARAVAVAQPNPVTGQVVCLRFAVEPGADADVVRARLQAELQRRLPKAAWPRNWVIDELAPVQNAKRSLR